MLTTEQLDELDRLEKAATPGPWGTAVTTWGDLREHALLLCAMRNALPELIAMARQLLRANECIEVLENSNRVLVDGREEWARRCREMAKNQ
jgi:tagatose-1,6-bisphosphate aldolase non-catalytic subunit AgaZ/GatZ